MEEVFLRVLNMGITAGYCVLVILLLRLFLKKLPKIYSYVLWSVVYFRLVCPVSVKSVFSLLRVNPQTVPSDIGTRINPRITSGVPQVDVAVNAGLAQAAPEVGASANPMQIIVYAATIVWGIGVLLLFGYSVWSVLRLKRQLRGARRIGENLYESEKLHTPFVLGCFVPRIYLPAGLGDKERVYVLAHERTHIRRRDYLIKEAAFLVTCIYWFHPLIWLAFYLMCRDMEMSCDESVIRSMGRENKKEYSATLLSLACGRQILNGSPLAFGEGGVKGRITNVLRYKRPAFWGGVALAIVLAAVLLGLALNPKEQYTQDESYKKEEQLGEESDKVISKVEHEGEEAHPADNDAAGADGAAEKMNAKTAVPQNAGNAGAAVHREGFIEPVLHLHVSDYLADSDYIDTSLLPEEEYRALAILALQELYDLTGTQVEECYYYYNVQGNFLFAMSEADMDHDRTFYSRSFGEEDFAGAIAIPQMHLSNARRTWFSPVYQYDLPENFADLPDGEKAVWFLEHSAVFKGGTVADYWQTYGDDMPQLWRIAMEDGTAYEVLLDVKIDAATDITGPYPTSDFEH